MDPLVAFVVLARVVGLVKEVVSIVMGLDQHRAQISAEWVETVSGEVPRVRIAPADRSAVRKFFAPFRGEGLE